MKCHIMGHFIQVCTVCLDKNNLQEQKYTAQNKIRVKDIVLYVSKIEDIFNKGFTVVSKYISKKLFSFNSSKMVKIKVKTDYGIKILNYLALCLKAHCQG